MPAIAVGAAMIAAHAARRWCFVLRYRDERQIRIKGGGEQLAKCVHYFVDTHCMIINVAEVWLDVCRHQLEIEAHETVAESTSGQTARLMERSSRFKW